MEGLTRDAARQIRSARRRRRYAARELKARRDGITAPASLDRIRQGLMRKTKRGKWSLR